MPTPTADATAAIPRNPLRLLARHRALVGWGLLCLLLTNGLAQSIPWVVKRTIEAIEGVAASGDPWPATRLALLVAALAVGQALLRILSRVLVFNAGRDAEYELRGALFAHLVRLDGSFYRRYRTGDLMSRLTNDLGSVRTLYGAGVLHAVNTIFGYAVALPLMLRIDAGLTFWALAPYPVLLLGARFFARGIYRRSRELQQSLSTLTSSVQEDLAGIRELKGYRLERARTERFAATSAQYLSHAVRLASWRAGLFPFVGLGAGASLVLVLWLGGQRVIAGSLTLGDLVALNMYVGMLAWPTMAIGWVLSLWQRGVAAWHRLRALLCEQSALAEAEVEPTKPPGEAAEDAPLLRLQDLTVTLERPATDRSAAPDDPEPPGEPEEAGAREEEPVLRGVSFEIAPNTICAVVGRIGCGKTTLAEAVARLLPVPAGSIFYGGRDVREQRLADVRGQIAYAPQDAFLFSMTLFDNVAFGLPADLPGAQRATRVEEAIRAAGLAADIQRLPEGVQTVVGERGVQLSGGQRQRVALARALAAGRPFLILDDSLSSVDAETEREILEGLGEVLRDRTAILISHRLSALQHAQQVVVLDGGEVAEHGTHEALLERGGIYAQLYRQQLLREQVSAAHEVGLEDAGLAPAEALAPGEDERLGEGELG